MQGALLKDHEFGGTACVVGARARNSGDIWHPETQEYVAFEVTGEDNPLYQAVKEDPLRLQDMVLTFSLGEETDFIKILRVTRFENHENIISCEANYEFLDNFKFAKAVQKWKRANNE